MVDEPEHLREQEVLALENGTASATDLARLHRHIARCADCRRWVAQVATAAPADDPDEAPPPSARRARPGPDDRSGPDVADAGSDRLPYGFSGRPYDSSLVSVQETNPRESQDPEERNPYIPWDPPIHFEEFELKAPIGAGAMGRVYRGEDTLLAREVAVKFLNTQASDRARARFLTEARAIARLNHPNVVTLYRVGELESHPYLVSEFVKGETLDKVPRPMKWEQVLNVAVQVCQGLAEAHRNGVLHRDIKPANIILAADGKVKLLDFGLAKLLDPNALPGAGVGTTGMARLAADMPQQASATGALVGTPLFMGPEIWLGESPSARSDVYALAGVLYDLCSGRPPHQGTTVPLLRQAVTQHPADPLLKHAPSVHPPLAKLIDRCLRPNPQERPASGVELLAELRAIEEQIRRMKRLRSPAVWVPVTLAVAGVVGGGVYEVARRRPPTPGELVELPGGEFHMGSSAEEITAAYNYCIRQTPPGPEQQKKCPRDLVEREGPDRVVTISPFRIDAVEVTYGQFAEWLNTVPGLTVRRVRQQSDEDPVLYLGDTPLIDMFPSHSPGFGLGLNRAAGRIQVKPGFERRPVTQVTWYGAKLFCESRGLRLPTEAEWEYAARGRDRHEFPWGSDDPSCADMVFGRAPGQPCAHLERGTAEVGTKPKDRTREGVYDLAGNVSEWVLDVFRPTYPTCQAPCLDPLEQPASDSSKLEARIFRGGDFEVPGYVCRGAARSRRSPNTVDKNIGFRCAGSINPGTGPQLIDPPPVPPLPPGSAAEPLQRR